MDKDLIRWARESRHYSKEAGRLRDSLVTYARSHPAGTFEAEQRIEEVRAACRKSAIAGAWVHLYAGKIGLATDCFRALSTATIDAFIAEGFQRELQSKGAGPLGDLLTAIAGLAGAQVRITPIAITSPQGLPPINTGAKPTKNDVN